LGIHGKSIKDLVDIASFIIFERLEDFGLPDEVLDGLVFPIKASTVILLVNLYDLDGTFLLSLAVLAVGLFSDEISLCL